MKIKYIGRITDPNEYDMLLIECLSARLAADIAYAVTNNNALTATMWEMYNQKLREARFVDATEGMPGTEGVDNGVMHANTFINSRF